MTSGKVGGFWDDQQCSEESAFLCEKARPDISPPTKAPTPPPSQGCADSWTALPHFRNCYKVKLHYLGWYFYIDEIIQSEWLLNKRLVKYI